MDLLIDLEETQEGVAHRPARLYQFDKQKYAEFLSEGFSFELKEGKKKQKNKEKSLA
jgi:8-oxo-dGTP diphosphatase